MNFFKKITDEVKKAVSSSKIKDGIKRAVSSPIAYLTSAAAYATTAVVPAVHDTVGVFGRSAADFLTGGYVMSSLPEVSPYLATASGALALITYGSYIDRKEKLEKHDAIDKFENKLKNLAKEEHRHGITDANEIYANVRNKLFENNGDSFFEIFTGAKKMNGVDIDGKIAEAALYAARVPKEKPVSKIPKEEISAEIDRID